MDKSSFRDFIAILLVTVISVAEFFNVQIANGFTMLFGDQNDAVIGISILEHWRAVFDGNAVWNRVSYFYPYPDSLGYNDGLLLYGIPYTLGRWQGLDPFLCAEIVSMVVRAIGCIAFFIMARAVFGFRLGLALLGAALFTVAGNAAVQGNHAQLFSVSFIPLLVVLVYRAIQAARIGKRARGAAWGVAAALFFDSWMLTSFYTAWFTALLLLLTAIPGLLVTLPWRGSWRAIVADRWPAALAAGVAVLGIVPFLLVYVPKLKESGAHRFVDVRDYAPRLVDLINPRLADGAVQKPLHWLLSFYATKNVDPNGFAPLLLALAAIGVLLALIELPRSRRVGSVSGRLWSALALGTLAAVLAVTHMQGWRVVYALVPGANGIRDISRFFLVLSVPIILLALLTLQSIDQWVSRRNLVAARVLCALLSIGLLVEEKATSVPIALDRRAGLQLLDSIPPAPRACRAFFVTGHSPEFPTRNSASDRIYRHNVDAMLISAVDGLPTINGFSTFNPPDWQFADVDDRDYIDRVGLYALRHHLVSGLCALNLSARHWDLTPSLRFPGPTLNQTIQFDAKTPLAHDFLVEGWGEQEPEGVWSIARHAVIATKLPLTAIGRPLTVAIGGSALLPSGQPPVPFSVVINGQLIDTLHFGPTSTVQTFRVPKSAVDAEGMLTITLREGALHTPRELRIAPDDRLLGLFIRTIRFDPGDAGQR
ncbi:hypothetical protein NFI95_11630 [Acetobacteraceae bacterium KSS8]|uniref:Glycosyltransferase RgtA/B/C/D-like domain-containing protein n=1 Tax=Endosaccharibacter trunci TaxID=2812733 RepID=A0ABT1W883_9PROT|nr:hypothetical protein [Acetobacteraceae bacterium KSS8]